MRLAPEGRPFLVVAAVLATFAWAAAFAAGGRAWLVGLAVLATGLLGFVATFFRNPARPSAADAEVVLAPAVGRVLSIGEVREPSFFEGPARRISIFLSIFDVHVQRAPVSGTVTHQSYRRGTYAVAWHPKASDQNEQASLGIRTERGPVLVRQIAGLVARRIVTDPVEGDAVTRGQRIGIIRFGSRVDLFLPLDWEVTSREGDVVRGGLTPMARAAAAAPARPEGAHDAAGGQP